jgi:hypothetical protein
MIEDPDPGRTIQSGARELPSRTDDDINNNSSHQKYGRHKTFAKSEASQQMNY